MDSQILPSPELLCQILRCDPDAGRLFWRERSRSLFDTDWAHPRWNTRWAGKEAFTAKNAQGYMVGAIFGKLYRAHRIIWTMENGSWPDSEIDHIDGNRANNMIINLRKATREVNSKNICRPKDNTSGAIGVTWEPRRNRWVAFITYEGKRHQIGRYLDINDAIEARKSADKKHGYHQNHGRI